MEDDIIAKVMTEEAYLAEQHGLKLGRGIDMEGGCATEQSEGGYHADKVWKCILLSNFCVFIVLLLSRVIDSSNCGNVLMSIDVIVSIIIFLLAPVDSDKKILSNNERKVYRMIVLFILVSQFVFCLLLRDRAEIVTLSNIIVLISMIKVPDRDTSR